MYRYFQIAYGSYGSVVSRLSVRIQRCLPTFVMTKVMLYTWYMYQTPTFDRVKPSVDVVRIYYDA